MPLEDKGLIMLYNLWDIGAYDWECNFWDDVMEYQGIDIRDKRTALFPYMGYLNRFLGAIEVEACFEYVKRHLDDKEGLSEALREFKTSAESRQGKYEKLRETRAWGKRIPKGITNIIRLSGRRM